MKINYVLSFLMFTTLALRSQTDKNVEDHQFKVNFLAPSLEYEKGAGKNTTFNFELGTGFAFRSGSEIGSDFGFFPYAEGQYRYYTNFGRRISKDKNVAWNTGNYVAGSILYTSGNSILGDINLNSNTNFFVGPLYGLQRTSRSGFNFGLEVGAGYFQNDVDSGVSVRIDFNIGWVIGRNRGK